ncbi:hypothetical protein BCR44DRAFT_1440422 [Catenaria anguillulae PL171]|uniref:DNA replication complex GINS protein PSF2 n=1 Tax=Catenaria anguillulae PL171 TaxID=765915 RepID=A0A1Y2HCT0_9FUNG|nr:hypothetical protein BCR44DRAFT_1440422 [Catenaria anguillulae PL171]
MDPLSTLSPEELEFLAENEPISIMPTTRIEKMELISACYHHLFAPPLPTAPCSASSRPPLNRLGPYSTRCTGRNRPLMATRATTVPLWLALVLRKRGMCQVIPPEWLSADSLQEKVRQETTEEGFSDLPFHYMAMAKLLLENAKDDIRDAHLVSSLLQDLREARRSKARQGVAFLTRSHIQVDNLSLMEINELRPTFSKAFQTAKRIQLAAGSDGHVGGGLSMSMSGGSQGGRYAGEGGGASGYGYSGYGSR